MKKVIRYIAAGIVLTLLMPAAGCVAAREPAVYEEESVPKTEMPNQDIVITINDNIKTPAQSSDETSDQAGDGSLINPKGYTLEERILTPDGYGRIPKETKSFQGYVRQYQMKPDQSPVLLYDGREKGNQKAHAAVFAMPVFDRDLQQCADSIIRIYAEYFWSVQAFDKIKFHLTNGFLMDYPTWQSGKRIAVDGNKVSWVQKSSYDDSYDTFLTYLQYVMMYAGTLSLDEESVPADMGQIQAGDMFIKGGSPGHCVMVADVAEDEHGNRCFLLAQGYMPAQEFHIIKNPLHEEDPWYYVSELTNPLVTPEYVFQEGCFKRWNGFLN